MLFHLRYYNLILIVFFCKTSSALSDFKNATNYKLLYDQIHNFEESFLHGNFNHMGIEETCVNQIEALQIGVNSTFGLLQLWAVKMFDAMGKLEPGILEGNFYSLGSYDECLSIKDEQVMFKDVMLSISGKYCVIHLVGTDNLNNGQGTNGLLSWGTCTPSGCSVQDMNRLLEVIDLPLKYDDLFCQVYEEKVKLSTGDIITIVFLSLIGLITVISTTYDVYKPRNTETSSNNSNRKLEKILLSFSILSNGRKLFSTVKNPEQQIECLAGLRAISMMWIILGHSFSYSGQMKPTANLAALQAFFENRLTMYVRGAIVSVDTFFLLSGMVLIYSFLKYIKAGNVKFNLFFFYLHRYLRLTPALGVVILIHVTLLRHFGSGPLWPYIDTALIHQCEVNWWVSLLYLQNIVNTPDMCIGQTWFLAVDTQLFLFSPIVLIPLRRWRKSTLIFIIIIICAVMSSTFACAWLLELHEQNSKLGTLTQQMSLDYTHYFYTFTFHRASPWLIGLLAGYCIFEVKVEKRVINIDPKLNKILWICSLSVLSTCVFYDLAQDDYNKIAQSLYMVFMRPAWAIALSWVVFACVTGNGGIINWFLSLSIFQILARFTYSIFLVHMSIIIAVCLAQKTTVLLSNSSLLFEFWSMYCLCLGVGIVWTLLFESPIIALEKALKLKPQ